MQVAVETIYNAIQTAIYTLILYSMMGFEWKAANFLWFYYYILMSFIYFTLYGMMLVALTPGHHVAGISMSFFLSFWNLFSGFIIPRTVCNPPTFRYLIHIYFTLRKLYSFFFNMLKYTFGAKFRVKTEVGLFKYF
jgi:hypothetical protein